MYILTLTRMEREAFDWVGNRYFTGEVATIIKGHLEPDDTWDQDGDLLIRLPEHAAWKIRDLADKENYSWPCFSYPLECKLNRFLAGIV